MKTKRDKLIHDLLKQGKTAEVAKLLSESDNNFWDLEYPKKSREEKIDYWSGSLYDQMRQKGHMGYDEMEIFTPEEYNSWKQHDPDIDEILDEILIKLNFNKEKAYKLLGIFNLIVIILHPVF